LIYGDWDKVREILKFCISGSEDVFYDDVVDLTKRIHREIRTHVTLGGRGREGFLPLAEETIRRRRTYVGDRPVRSFTRPMFRTGKYRDSILKKVVKDDKVVYSIIDVDEKAFEIHRKKDGSIVRVPMRDVAGWLENGTVHQKPRMHWRVIYSNIPVFKEYDWLVKSRLLRIRLNKIAASVPRIPKRMKK